MTRVTSLAGAPVIVGAGLAGLATALSLAPRRCIVLTASPLGTGAATAWAQGGIAAAIGPDDEASLHLADTLAAGDGLCDAEAAGRIIAEGSRAIGRLTDWGVRFDLDRAGRPVLGLEAAHGRHRIVHADGDGTGREVLRALVARVRATPSIEVLDGARGRQILRDAEGRIAGIVIERADGSTQLLRTSAVVIATGGLGGLYTHTTNPLGAVGGGLALAAEAGASFAELEFVQFHPTAIDGGRDPMPLASEALRGEGAILIDEAGRRFMLGDAAADGRAELAPRDIVARAIAARLAEGSRVFLDARDALGARFASRFPSIHALCREGGIDPAIEPIPVRPAAHYAMGGIVVDADGRGTVEGLWACGEAAATGLHGANRLASNSLLEAAVMGARVGQALAAMPDAPVGRVGRVPPLPRRTGDASLIRPIMARGFGVLRDEAGMGDAATDILDLAGRADIDRSALVAARLVAASALLRRESRGAHARRDVPERDVSAIRRTLTLADADAVLLPHASRTHHGKRRA